MFTLSCFHQDDPTPLVDLASCLVRTGCGLLGAGGDPPPRAGVFVFVYTPRYRGMGAAVREACARLGVHMRTMNRASILSEVHVCPPLAFSPPLALPLCVPFPRLKLPLAYTSPCVSCASPPGLPVWSGGVRA